MSKKILLIRVFVAGSMKKIKKKWRRINPYRCKCCGKKRFAFGYDRAKTAVCRKCEKEPDNENQPTLF